MSSAARGWCLAYIALILIGTYAFQGPVRANIAKPDRLYGASTSQQCGIGGDSAICNDGSNGQPGSDSTGTVPDRNSKALPRPRNKHGQEAGPAATVAEEATIGAAAAVSVSDGASPLLVSLMDGRVVAVDQQTGKKLWSLDTGPPLVSSWTCLTAGNGARGSRSSSSTVPGGGLGPEDCAADGVHVFPGLDGSLFSAQGGHDMADMQRLPLSVQQLVQEAPSLTQDKGLLLGSRRSTVFLVDESTGATLRTLWDHEVPSGDAAAAVAAAGLGPGGALPGMHDIGPDKHTSQAGDGSSGQTNGSGDGGEANGGDGDEEGDDGLDMFQVPLLGRRHIAVARQDFFLQSVDLESGELRWNLSYSRLRRLSAPGAKPSAAGGLLDGDAAQEAHLATGGAAPAAPRLVLGPNTVQGSGGGGSGGGGGGSGGGGRGNKGGGRAGDWTVSFDAPVASLLTPGEGMSPKEQLNAAAGVGPGVDDDEPMFALQTYRGQTYARPAPAMPPPPPALVEGPADTACVGGESAANLPVPAYIPPGARLIPGGDGAAGGLRCPGGWDMRIQEQWIPGFLPLPGAAGPPQQQQQPALQAAQVSGAHGAVQRLLLWAAERPALALPVLVALPLAVVLTAVLLLSRSRASATSAAAAAASVADVTQQQPLLQQQQVNVHAVANNGETLQGAAGSSIKDGKRGGGRKAGGGGVKSRSGGGKGAVSNRVRGMMLKAGEEEEGEPAVLGAEGEWDEGGRRVLAEAAASNAASRAAQRRQGSADGATIPSATWPSEQQGSGGGGSFSPTSDGGMTSLSAPSSTPGSHSSSAQGWPGPPPPPLQPVVAPSMREREQLGCGGTRVGHIEVYRGVLGIGSAGTVVFEGAFNGRPVAVKRLLRHMYELAHKEIAALIVSDEHPNIVRCHALEEDGEFIYLALERCRRPLSEIATDREFAEQLLTSAGQEEGQAAGDDAAASSPAAAAAAGGAAAAARGGGAALVGSGRRASEYAMRLARDVAEGVAALHARGIVHRDLKPHNVLLAESGAAKLSDMGLSKKLTGEETSFESHGGPGGSSGWQSPEQLVSRSGGQVKQSRSMDVFSLGLLLFYIITGGGHPFGAAYERDSNILSGRPNFALLSHLPDALSLLGAMLAHDPKKRPTMAAVLAHPFWWPKHLQLQFLIEVSDRVENEDREEDRTLLLALESFAPAALHRPPSIGPARQRTAAAESTSGGAGGGNWLEALDEGLLANLGTRFRRYNGCSLRDLLRVVRNKHNHFRELPPELQQRLGPLPDGYLKYFLDRFPCLLMAAFSFAALHCSSDPHFTKYFPEGSLAHPFALDFMKRMPTELPSQALPPGLISSPSRIGPNGSSRPPRPPPAPQRGYAGSGNGWGQQQQQQQGSQGQQPPSSSSQHGGPDAHGGGGYGSPQGPSPHAGAPHAGAEGQQSLPPALAAVAAAAPQHGPTALLARRYLHGPGAQSCMPPLSQGGDHMLGPMVLPAFPSRPGELPCDYFRKTGHCKYGMQCRFDHPASCRVPLNACMLPLRPGQAPCTFYMRYGLCRFGASCKFHHPNLAESYRFEPAPQRILEALDDQWASPARAPHEQQQQQQQAELQQQQARAL